MKVGVLTSSRADYGIYQPLLNALQQDPFFDLHMLAFGTHFSQTYGNTIQQIEADGYFVAAKIDTMPGSDSAKDIALAIGKAINGFSEIWASQHYELVFALGDRYEMFGAVSASVPFNVAIAHLHGGETTLGAIDNAFRHAITSMSRMHFTAAEEYRQRVIEIVGNDENIFNVGALSIDNIKQLNLLSIMDFNKRFNIDLSLPTILITLHPETENFKKNKDYVQELINALEELKSYQLVITMPNADTMASYIRENLNNFIENTSNAMGVENFGALGYLSCMKHCKLMMGNSSSGFIEAAGFNKAVVNLGARQTGRILTPNIFSVPIIKTAIIAGVEMALRYNRSENIEIYGNGNTAIKICNILKSIL